MWLTKDPIPCSYRKRIFVLDKYASNKLNLDIMEDISQASVLSQLWCKALQNPRHQLYSTITGTSRKRRVPLKWPIMSSLRYEILLFVYKTLRSKKFLSFCESAMFDSNLTSRLWWHGISTKFANIFRNELHSNEVPTRMIER